MALTGIRWIAWCLVGCCIVATLLLTDTRPEPFGWQRDELDRRRSEIADRRNMAQMHVGTVAERLYVLQKLDSVQRARRLGDTAVVDPTFQPALKGIVRRAVERSTKQHRGLRVDFAILQDSANTTRNKQAAPRRRFSGIVAMDFRIPAGPGTNCVAVARINSAAQGIRWSSVVGEISSDVTATRLSGP